MTSASSVTGPPQVDSSANNLSSLNSLPVLNGGQPETEVVPDGLAPIAKTEEMSDDLSEETLVNGETNPNSSTPIKKGASDWRLTNGNGSVVNKSLASGDLPWWSEEDDDKKQIEKRRCATETEIKTIIQHIQLRMDLNRFLAQTKRMKVTGSALIPTQPQGRDF